MIKTSLIIKDKIGFHARTAAIFAKAAADCKSDIFVEFNGYNSKGNIFYKAGLDFQHEVFNVLSNSSKIKSLII